MTPHIEDRLLTIDEAAEVLRTTKDYLYRHHKDLPFTVRLSPRQLRFSSKGIERYILRIDTLNRKLLENQ